MKGKSQFPNLREDLRESLWHIERLRRITPQDLDLRRLEEAFRERLDVLEAAPTSEYQQPMAA